MKNLYIAAKCLAILLLLWIPASAQTTFNNPAAITINDAAVASPYPSNITVSGMGLVPFTPNAVQVRLNNWHHTFADDVGIVIVGPTGAALMLQDGAGGDTTTQGTITYTISDSGAAQLPGSGTWPAGTYKPANYYSPADSFPAPGPGTTYNDPGPASGGTATFQSTFGGTNPNGVWRLYVVDFVEGDSGAIDNGWSLTLTSQPLAADATVSGNLHATDGRGLSGAYVLLTDNAGHAKTVMSGAGGYFEFTEVETGETYVLTVKSRKYRFAPVVVQINDSLEGILLTAESSLIPPEQMTK